MADAAPGPASCSLQSRAPAKVAGLWVQVWGWSGGSGLGDSGMHGRAPHTAGGRGGGLDAAAGWSRPAGGATRPASSRAAPSPSGKFLGAGFLAILGDSAPVSPPGQALPDAPPPPRHCALQPREGSAQMAGPAAPRTQGRAARLRWTSLPVLPAGKPRLRALSGSRGGRGSWRGPSPPCPPCPPRPPPGRPEGAPPTKGLAGWASPFGRC